MAAPIKSSEEITRELTGEAVDLLPNVQKISDKDFANIVDAVANSKKVQVQGHTIDGTGDVNPLDVALLCSRIENPAPLTTKMHDELVNLSNQMDKKNQRGIDASIGALQQESAQGIKMSALVKPEHLAALIGAPTGPSTPGGTSVSSNGPNVSGNARGGVA